MEKCVYTNETTMLHNSVFNQDCNIVSDDTFQNKIFTSPVHLPSSTPQKNISLLEPVKKIETISEQNHMQRVLDEHSYSSVTNQLNFEYLVNHEVKEASNDLVLQNVSIHILSCDK